MFKKYAKYYDLFNQDKPYKKEIDFVYKWADKPSSIFDVGPGTAHYWQFFPERCFLLGVDKSKEMMDQYKGNRGFILHGDIQGFHLVHKFDCVVSLFDVINYIPTHDWWKDLPLKSGGCFVFDLWDKDKVDKTGFTQTLRKSGEFLRVITPLEYDGRNIDLEVKIILKKDIIGDEEIFTEIHRMHVFSLKDIEKFCGDDFEIEDVKKTESWQTWIKLRKK